LHQPSLLLFEVTRRPPRPTLFPYTTLFRSRARRHLPQELELPVVALRDHDEASEEARDGVVGVPLDLGRELGELLLLEDAPRERDRKSTRLNSSHSQISYAVFCLKKKKKQQ